MRNDRSFLQNVRDERSVRYCRKLEMEENETNGKSKGSVLNLKCYRRAGKMMEALCGT